MSPFRRYLITYVEFGVPSFAVLVLAMTLPLAGLLALGSLFVYLLWRSRS